MFVCVLILLKSFQQALFITQYTNDRSLPSPKILDKKPKATTKATLLATNNLNPISINADWSTCLPLHCQQVLSFINYPYQWRIYIVKFWTRPSPHPGVQILSISCSFGENLAKSYVGAPPGKILHPPLHV